MEPNTRRRFLSVSDWHSLLNEVKANPGQEVNLYHLRQACFKDIERIRGRKLLVYAVRFPSSTPPPPAPQPPISIDLNDIDGFTDLVQSIKDEEAVDVLIHSPGGSPEATERIVALLRSNFGKVSFLVPHSAYSAATMMALSGDEIVLHHSASLGPIDPQVNGTPARAIRRGFDNAREALKEEGPEALPAYVPLIEKYSLELLEVCQDYEKLSKELVSEWLKKYMFAGADDMNGVVDNAVEFFSAYDNHRSHSRALTFDKLEGLELEIKVADGELSDLLREAHILLNGFMSVTPFVKLFENASGLSWGRQFELVAQPQQSQQKQG